MPELFDKCEGFQWDAGNSAKNWIRHGVSRKECEQVFFNKPYFVSDDTLHSEAERRFYLLGHADSNRLLFVVFTIRGNLIRVISARDMNKKERKAYNDQAKEHPEF